MAANPDDIVRDVLQIVGLANNGLVNNRQTTRFMNANNIEDMNDFATLHTTQVKEMVKQYQRGAGAAIIGIRAQNNLQGLIWHARDMQRQNRLIDVNDIDVDMLEAAREDYQMYLKDLEMGLKITELEKFVLKKDFSDWDDSITESLGRIMGAQEAPIDYLIRPNQLAGFTPRNPKEALMYALPLNGRKFDRDNSTLFSLLAVATLDTLAWTYVNNYKNQLDGRAAMMALRDHYDGDASNNKKLTKYQNIISNIEYLNERSATWENQSTTLIKAYQWMETRANQTYTDDIKVIKLSNMIKVANNNALAIAIEIMRNTYRTDFNGAMVYITGRINELNAIKPSAATRHISETQRKTKWNGIDISNPFRSFTNDEWNQLQRNGQELVGQYRSDDQQNKGRGGQGRHGRGRGGRGYSARGHGGHGYGGGRGGRGGRYHRGGRHGRGGRDGRSGRGRGDNDDRSAQEVNTDKNGKKPEEVNSKETLTPNPKGGTAGVHFK